MKKHCPKCDTTKSTTSFGKNKGRKDGLQGWCKVCRSGKYYAEYQQKYRDENKLKRRAYQRRYWRENKETAQAGIKRWRERNKEELREYYRHYRAEYRAMLEGRTVEWADREAINLFYQNCPDGFHVDHIVPLQGKNVSGLHVIENLQYLTARENLQKGNRF